MSRITVSRANYKFPHYEQSPVKLTAYNGGYSRKLYKDQYHKTSVKLIIPDNVSDLIYGKCK
jgi:CO dehydrogenase/acetyl-CoA synthase beta subunit